MFFSAQYHDPTHLAWLLSLHPVIGPTGFALWICRIISSVLPCTWCYWFDPGSHLANCQNPIVWPTHSVSAYLHFTLGSHSAGTVEADLCALWSHCNQSHLQPWYNWMNIWRITHCTVSTCSYAAMFFPLFAKFALWWSIKLHGLTIPFSISCIQITGSKWIHEHNQMWKLPGSLSYFRFCSFFCYDSRMIC
jgi:hypothetical protein